MTSEGTRPVCSASVASFAASAGVAWKPMTMRLGFIPILPEFASIKCRDVNVHACLWAVDCNQFHQNRFRPVTRSTAARNALGSRSFQNVELRTRTLVAACFGVRRPANAPGNRSLTTVASVA